MSSNPDDLPCTTVIYYSNEEARAAEHAYKYSRPATVLENLSATAGITSLVGVISMILYFLAFFVATKLDTLIPGVLTESIEAVDSYPLTYIFSLSAISAGLACAYSLCVTARDAVTTRRINRTYQHHLESGHIISREIPFIYEKYWTRVQHERQEARKPHGIIGFINRLMVAVDIISVKPDKPEEFDDYTIVLADRPEVLSELKNFIWAVTDSRTGDSEREACEKRIMTNLHLVADELYGSVESESIESQAHNEGVRRLLDNTPE